MGPYHIQRVALAMAFIASSVTALDSYKIPALSHQSSDTHVVVEAKIEAAIHTDADSVVMSASAPAAFRISNFTTATTSGVRSIQATISTSTGAMDCKFDIGTPEFTSDTMYPCTGAGGGGLIAYPQASHVVILGYHSVNGHVVMGNGHGDLELSCSGEDDGVDCVQDVPADILVSAVLGWVDPALISE